MVFLKDMAQKIIILYNLKDKTQSEKVQALRKLFGYRDRSNYDYQYDRTGELAKVKLSKSKKSVLELDNEKDLAKVAEILKKLNIKFDVAKIQ